jgi:hypothetical protein
LDDSAEKHLACPSPGCQPFSIARPMLTKLSAITPKPASGACRQSPCSGSGRGRVALLRRCGPYYRYGLCVSVAGTSRTGLLGRRAPTWQSMMIWFPAVSPSCLTHWTRRPALADHFGRYFEPGEGLAFAARVAAEMRAWVRFITCLTSGTMSSSCAASLPGPTA